MSLRDMKNSLSSFWREFRRYKYGMVGIAFLLIFIAMVVFEPFIIAFPEANRRWRDITYWEDNPVNAHPAWVNFFTSKDLTPTTSIHKHTEQVQEDSGLKFYDYEFTYDYAYDIAPNDILFRAKAKGDVSILMSVVRPDNQEISLFEYTTSSSELRDMKASVGKASISNLIEFAQQYDTHLSFDSTTRNTMKPAEIIFAEAKEGIATNPAPLKGEYKFKVTAVMLGDGTIEKPHLVVAGKVFGLLGTDAAKRDIWSGVICGVKWALLIGLLTSFVSVVIGVLYGVASAFFGGWVDSAMMRFYEVFSSIPMLPVFIVVGAVFKPSIWTMIIMMCLFFWTGAVRTVRSIGLQIKEETYVEAAHALNASSARIIFRHMVPQLVPFSFASMALSVPGAILYEATVSLLGLGDATIVTWGQILHDAMQANALLQGLWWWVVPPGLFIALMGMTFNFVGFAMDTILNPKLRTR